MKRVYRACSWYTLEMLMQKIAQQRKTVDDVRAAIEQTEMLAASASGRDKANYLFHLKRYNEALKLMLENGAPYTIVKIGLPL